MKFHPWFVQWQSRRAARDIAAMRPSSVLEIGAGNGWLTREMRTLGLVVVSSDYEPSEPWIVQANAHFLPFHWDEFDLVVCSNTLEHLHSPERALREMKRVGRRLWLSWTPWNSPFGGHDFSPWHYFGKTEGKYHQLGKNLFLTRVDWTLDMMTRVGWKVESIVPRYWPQLGFLARWKWTREWATWNVLIRATT